MAARKPPTSKLTWGRVMQLRDRVLGQYEGSKSPSAGSPAPTDSAEAQMLSRNQVIELMRQHRFLERPVDIPKAYEKTTKAFRSPLAFDQVQRIVAVLTSGKPIVQVPPRSPSQDDISNAAHRERWLTAAMLAMDIQREDVSVPWLVVDAQAADGLGVIKLSYHPSRYADDAGFPDRAKYSPPDDVDGDVAIEKAYLQSVAEFKRRADFPFSWRDVDAMNYFPVKGYDGRRAMVLERHQVDVEALVTEYAGSVGVNDSGNLTAYPAPKTEGGAPSLRPADDVVTGQLVDLWEIWSHDEWSLWTEGVNQSDESVGVLLDAGDNPFNELPYFEFPGLITSARDVGRRTLSVLFPSAHLYDSLNTEITKGMNISHVLGYPTWMRQGGLLPGGESADEQDDRERIETGVIYDLQLGGDMRMLSPPDMGRLWDTLVSFMMRMQDQVGLSSLTRGEGLGADASGYLFAQIASAAQGIYGPMQASAERAYIGITRALQWCIQNTVKTGVVVEVVGKKGSTDWLELTPDDIDEYYKTKVRVKPSIPTNQVAQGNFAASMNAAGLLSKLTGRTDFMELEDPERERLLLMWERIQESPEYTAAAAQEMLVRELGVPEPGNNGEASPGALAAADAQAATAPSTGAAGLPGPQGIGPGTGNITVPPVP